MFSGDWQLILLQALKCIKDHPGGWVGNKRSLKIQDVFDIIYLADQTSWLWSWSWWHHHHFLAITRRAGKNDQPINSRKKCWISAFGDNPFTIIIIAVVVILDAVFVLMMITIMRRAGKNDQPINSRIKCWINAFGDNPLQQSAIKSFKHSFHHTAHQENDTDAL